jgi:hypothetical protein
MSRLIIIALLVGATLGVIAASSEAATTSLRPHCQSSLLKSANHHRAIVIRKHGKRAPGRDIVRNGRIAANQRTVRATCAQVRKYRDQLVQLHTPAPSPLLVRTATEPARAPAGVQTASVRAPAGGTLAAIRQCESGGNYSTDTGNGFYGAYQFTQSTWQSVGGSGNPAAASPAEQDQRAAMLHAREGSSPWPVCGR